MVGYVRLMTAPLSEYPPMHGFHGYLPLVLQICFVSHEDHRKLIPILHPEDLPLEFVDLLKAGKKREEK